MPKLQTACTTQVMKDGMVVKVDDHDVKAGQAAIMEFLLINHPLDCPICDQAGECGLQDYSFKHGQAFSRFRFEEKRIYPAKERIPLGPHVLLNMNRCIQCTRCVRFTQEITKTGELGFFERGARAEIGTFPGQAARQPAVGQRRRHLPGRRAHLDRVPLRRARLVPRQEALALHRLRRRLQHHSRAPARPDPPLQAALQPRRQRLLDVRLRPRHLRALRDACRACWRRACGEPGTPASRSTWKDALDAVAAQAARPLRRRRASFLGSGFLTTEEAFLLAQPGRRSPAPRNRSVWVDSGPARTIPNPQGGITGHDAAPNRRGAELAGLVPGEGGSRRRGPAARRRRQDCPLLIVADSDFGTRRATTRRWSSACARPSSWWSSAGPTRRSAQAADVALPTATHAEREGTFVNVQRRLQRFDRAFPPPGEARAGDRGLRRSARPLRSKAGRASPPPRSSTRLAQQVPALAGASLDARFPPTDPAARARTRGRRARPRRRAGGADGSAPVSPRPAGDGAEDGRSGWRC